MPHVRVGRVSTGLPENSAALGPPGRRFLGILLVVAGLAVVGWGLSPVLAGAAAPPDCKADGTDKPSVPCVFDPEDEEGVPLASLSGVDVPVFTWAPAISMYDWVREERQLHNGIWFIDPDGTRSPNELMIESIKLAREYGYLL